MTMYIDDIYIIEPHEMRIEYGRQRLNKNTRRSIVADWTIQSFLRRIYIYIYNIFITI